MVLTVKTIISVAVLEVPVVMCDPCIFAWTSRLSALSLFKIVDVLYNNVVNSIFGGFLCHCTYCKHFGIIIWSCLIGLTYMVICLWYFLEKYPLSGCMTAKHDYGQV